MFVLSSQGSPVKTGTVPATVSMEDLSCVPLPGNSFGEKAEGFQAFPGPQLAGFTPEQQAAFATGREQFTGLAGTPLGQAATYYQPALAATALGTAEIGAEDNAF